MAGIQPKEQRPEPLLTTSIQRRLGQRLRAGYLELEREALPDAHVDLLLRLRHKERDRRLSSLIQPAAFKADW